MSTPGPVPHPRHDTPVPHPLLAAVRPLVDAMGGELLDPAVAAPEDVVLRWEGEEVVAVRLPGLGDDSLDRIVEGLERVHGPLAALDRRTKQDLVRRLEARGAFTVRHGVETVAAALGVSRFTVYNYLRHVNEQRVKER